MKSKKTKNKYFIPLGPKYGSFRYLGYEIYGPYEKETDAREEIGKLKFDKETEFLVFEGGITKFDLPPKSETGDEKREPGNAENYETKGDSLICRKCGAAIIGATVLHPIFMRDTENQTGDYKRDLIPYCPNCDREPNSKGLPIYL